jgi:hypothetical protein
MGAIMKSNLKVDRLHYLNSAMEQKKIKIWIGDGEWVGGVEWRIDGDGYNWK